MPGLGQALGILLCSGKGWLLSKAGCGGVLFFAFFFRLAKPSPLLNKKCFKNKNKIKAQLPEFLRELLCSEQRDPGHEEENRTQPVRTNTGGSAPTVPDQSRHARARPQHGTSPAILVRKGGGLARGSTGLWVRQTVRD